jgi:hypothetical protein
MGRRAGAETVSEGTEDGPGRRGRREGSRRREGPGRGDCRRRPSRTRPERGELGQRTASRGGETRGEAALKRAVSLCPIPWCGSGDGREDDSWEVGADWCRLGVGGVGERYGMATTRDACARGIKVQKSQHNY